MEPSAAALAFVEAGLGPVLAGSVRRLDRREGPDGVVGLVCETPAGPQAAVLKCCAAHRTFTQERVALGEWFGDRTALAPARVPRLLAFDRPRRWLLCSQLPGRRPSDAQHDASAVHRAAGRCLATLHQLEHRDHDPLSLDEALVRRHGSWLGRCSHALDATERACIEAQGPARGMFCAARRVPCHRDFTPDNWLWDGERLGLVDFEHARGDFALGDLAKLAVDSWAQRPELRVAFFEGYGRTLGRAEITQLRAGVVLHALASLSWGLHHADEAFIRAGRRALRWLSTTHWH